jgi:quinol monooxygenase YgiN
MVVYDSRIYSLQDQKEQQKEFEDAYKKAAESLEGSSYCLQYELSHCVEEPNNYILRIEWDSEEGHLKGFRASPEFQTFLEAVRPFFNNIEEMRHYELTRIKGEK